MPLSYSLHRSRPRDLDAGEFALHDAVRATYREAIGESRTQRQAFDEALQLVLLHVARTSDPDARRLVAHMLSEEPKKRPSSGRPPG